MKFLLPQLFNGLNLLKDILIPCITTFIVYWLASKKFKKEHIWQEKYSVYQEIFCAIEEMAYWIDEACNEAVMLPTIGWFDGKPPYEFYTQARRRLAKQANIGQLLLSLDTVAILNQLQTEIFREKYRAEEERTNMPYEENDDFRIHIQEMRKIISKYLLKLNVLARKDLGVVQWSHFCFKKLST